MKINDLKLPPSDSQPSNFELVHDYIYNYLDDRAQVPQPVSVKVVNLERASVYDLAVFEIGLGENFKGQYVALLTDTKDYVLILDSGYYLIDKERNITRFIREADLYRYIDTTGDPLVNVFNALTERRG